MGGTILVKKNNKKDWFLWLLGTLFLGPIALLDYAYVHGMSNGARISQKVETFRLAVFEAGPHTLGWGIAMVILVRLGGNPHPLFILGSTYLIPLLMAILLNRLPMVMSLERTSSGVKRHRSLLPEFISNNINFGVMFPLMMILNNRILTVIPDILTPYFWGMMSFLSLADFLVQYFIQAWMIRRGVLTWERGVELEEDLDVVPRMEKGWQILILSGLFLVITLAITITQFA